MGDIITQHADHSAKPEAGYRSIVIRGAENNPGLDLPISFSKYAPLSWWSTEASPFLIGTLLTIMREPAPNSPENKAANDLAVHSFDSAFPILPLDVSVTLRPDTRFLAFPQLGVVVPPSNAETVVTKVGRLELRLASNSSRTLKQTSATTCLPWRHSLEADRPCYVADGRLILPPWAKNRCASLAPTNTRDLRHTLEFIETVDPEIALMLKRIVQWYFPISAKDTDAHESFSSPLLAGVVFLSFNFSDPLILAEAIVHESGHNILHQLTRFQALTNSTTENRLFYSPWRTDARPIEGLLHAIYVICGVTEFLDRVRQQTSAKKTRQRVDSRVNICEWRLLTGVSQLRDLDLTPSGKLVVERAIDLLSRTGRLVSSAKSVPRVIGEHWSNWRRVYPDLVAISPEESIT